jgi:hypothetical protein
VQGHLERHAWHRSRVHKVMRAARRDHAKVCASGISRSIIQFDPSSSRLFDDPPANQFALKYAALRYIQTALSVEIFTLIRRRKLLPDEIGDLSLSVEERIRYAFRKHWVRKPSELIEAGLTYIKACNLQLELKIRYDTNGATTQRDESFQALNNDAVKLFQEQLLAD